MILVIAEHRDGTLNRASWESIVAAQAQAGAGGANAPVKVAVLGSAAHAGAVANELAAADVAEVIAVTHDLLASYTADGFTKALADLIAAEQPALVWLPHTYQTRDFAPR